MYTTDVLYKSLDRAVFEILGAYNYLLDIIFMLNGLCQCYKQVTRFRVNGQFITKEQF